VHLGDGGEIARRARTHDERLAVDPQHPRLTDERGEMVIFGGVDRAGITGG
jgi:hypothetical protein